jgi:hypothetical protein
MLEDSPVSQSPSQFPGFQGLQLGSGLRGARTAESARGAFPVRRGRRPWRKAAGTVQVVLPFVVGAAGTVDRGNPAGSTGN